MHLHGSLRRPCARPRKYPLMPSPHALMVQLRDVTRWMRAAAFVKPRARRPRPSDRATGRGESQD